MVMLRDEVRMVMDVVIVYSGHVVFVVIRHGSGHSRQQKMVCCEVNHYVSGDKAGMVIWLMYKCYGGEPSTVNIERCEEIEIQLLVHVVIPNHINVAFIYDICTIRTRKVTIIREKDLVYLVSSGQGVVGFEEPDNSKKNYDKSLVEEQVSQVKSSSVEGCGSNTSKSVSEVEPKKVRENIDAPIIEDWVSDDKEQDESKTKPEKKIVIPTAAKIEKPVKKSVRYAEMYRSQSPRGNQRNWNGQKSNQLGSEFVMYNKACFICGSFNHVQKNCTYHQKKKVVSGNNYNRVDNDYYAKTSHHRTHKNMTPRAVLLRTGLKPLSTAKSVYSAHPKPTVHCARPKTHFYK
ncbi:hypothetical protein Tco_1126474 [Tanacetum coccineum]